MCNKEKQFNNVHDLLCDIGIDKNIIAGVDAMIDNHIISKNLIISRTRANLTQQELADKIEKPVDFVENLEITPDADMRIGDLKAYAEGLGFDGVEVTFFHKDHRYGC